MNNIQSVNIKLFKSYKREWIFIAYLLFLFTIIPMFFLLMGGLVYLIYESWPFICNALYASGDFIHSMISSKVDLLYSGNPFLWAYAAIILFWWGVLGFSVLFGLLFYGFFGCLLGPFLIIAQVFELFNFLFIKVSKYILREMPEDVSFKEFCKTLGHGLLKCKIF